MIDYDTHIALSHGHLTDNNMIMTPFFSLNNFSFEMFEFNVWCKIELSIHVYNTIKNLTTFFSKSYTFYTQQYFFKLEFFRQSF